MKLQNPLLTRSASRIAAGFFGLVTSLVLVAVSAHAGDRLRLRTGEVDLTNASQATNALTLPHFEATPDEVAQTNILRPEWIATKGKRPGKKADARAIRHFVVQMQDHLSNEDFVNFKSLKLTIIRYIPDDAVVVAGTARKAQVLAKSSNRIRAISLYRPEWKLSPDLGTSSIFSGDPVVTSVVRLFPGQDVKSLSTQLKNSKVIVKSASGRTLVVESKRSLLQALAVLDPIEWIETAPVIELPWFKDDTLRFHLAASPGDYSDITGYESGTRLMKFDSVWARGFSGAGQVVGFADTGMDTGDSAKIHQDFTGRVPSGDIFGLFSKSWEDPMGHGTHVSGSVAGDGAASGGKIKGGANLATLAPQSMWSPMLDNLSVPSKLKDMFGKAYAEGARVHTNSWGAAAAVGVYDSMAQQVDEFIYANPDMLILFAAGNSGEDLDRDGRIDGNSIGTPGTAKNVLTVGASKNLVANGGIQAKMMDLREGKTKWGVEPIASSMLSENEKGMAAFSSRGPTADGRLKPEIVAPGTNILSTRSHHPKAEVLWGAYNDQYVWSGGTSMATPLAAGAAAVIREYLIKDRKIAAPSAAMLKAVMMHTAEDLFPGQFGAVGVSKGQEFASVRPNMDEGYGRVDVEKATQLASSLLVDERTGLGPSEKHLYPITLSKATQLSATLVYSDAPGAAAASKTLVNDLDLAIVDASGKRYAVGDHVNNNEHIAVSLPAGTYQIEVLGANVPITKQGYALVVSAAQ
ncbi:hypothetical protein BH10BDE1_BH10BDE1_10500 [soil metagenome]